MDKALHTEIGNGIPARLMDTHDAIIEKSASVPHASRYDKDGSDYIHNCSSPSVFSVSSLQPQPEERGTGIYGDKIIEQKKQSNNNTSTERTRGNIFICLGEKSQQQKSVKKEATAGMGSDYGATYGTHASRTSYKCHGVTYPAPADFKKLLAKAMIHTHRALNCQKGDDILLDQARRSKIPIEEARKRIFVTVRHELAKRYFEMMATTSLRSSNTSDPKVGQSGV